MPRTISCPYSGCSSMTRRSSGVSGPSLRNSRVGTPSLPTSCRIPANRSTSARSSSMPSSRAIIMDACPTRSLWPRVYPSLMSTAWTRARIVSWWAARSRWYWANTQQEMYIGSSTSSAATGPYGLRHRTAIIRPASPCTATGARARGKSPRQAPRSGTRSASARMPPSRRVRTRQKVEHRGPGGHERVRKVGRDHRVPAAERPVHPGGRPDRDGELGRAPDAAQPPRPLVDPGDQRPRHRDERGGRGRQQKGPGQQHGEEGAHALGDPRPAITRHWGPRDRSHPA